MTDLHTHILPGMDDGAKDVETSLAMLALEWEQRVRGVALTPHFYRDEERPERFFARRQRAWEHLLRGIEQSGTPCPDLVLGAEVAWVPGMNRWDELDRFCIGKSRYLLLELPDHTWQSSMFDQIYDMMDSGGVTPVLAHLERYFRGQKPDHIRELLKMGVPVQISAEPLLHMVQRFSLLQKIRGNSNCMLISDCHNLTGRRPNLGPAAAQVRRSLPPEQLSAMRHCSRRIFDAAAGKEHEYASK